VNLASRALRLLEGSGGYLLCAAGFTLTVVAFYPGLMSEDSVDQWTQGHTWWFYDVHPPLMSALWGLFDRVVPGPFLMLLFHNLLFWVGAALFWRLTKDRAGLLSLAFASFGFMPQAWALLSTIWKDVGLGAALLLGSALVYGAARKSSYALLVASCPLMFYGYGVRLNAAPALLPLAVWSGFVACRVFAPLRARVGGRKKLLPLACGLVYFAALTLAVSVTTKLLVKDHTVYPAQQIFLFDLAAISGETGQPQYPDYLARDDNFSPEAVNKAYSQCGVNPLIYGHSAPMKISRDADQVADLRARWLHAVAEHPSAYLSHRWGVFTCLTGFNTQYVVAAFLPATGLNNPPQFRHPLNALTRGLTSYFFYFSRSVFFRGFFWILACAGLSYVSLRLRMDADAAPAFALASSGLLYGLGYFFYTPSSEFRYLWWTALAACVSSILLAIHIVTQRRITRAQVPDAARGA
jgi:hypothetical protein